MIPFHTVFLIMVLIFALIGSLRGWAKEIIVAFSVLLALFLEQVLTSLVPPIAALWGAIPLMSRFWIRVVVFAVIVVFGYASPSLAARFGAKIARERLQDALLGFFIGVLNGLLIIGTIWFFLDDARYGVPAAQVIESQDLVVVEGTTDIVGMESLGGRRLAVIANSISEIEGRRQAAVLPGLTIFPYATAAEALARVASREVDAALVDHPSAKAGTAPGSGLLIAELSAVPVSYLADAEGMGGIHPPASDSPAANLLPYLPPRLIAGPPLYLAVGLAFVFVLIVFI